MSITELLTALNDLAAGDRVVLTDEKQAQCLTTLIDRREVPAIDGPGGREETILVRVPDGRWFNLADGRGHLDPACSITPAQAGVGG